MSPAEEPPRPKEPAEPPTPAAEPDRGGAPPSSAEVTGPDPEPDPAGGPLTRFQRGIVGVTALAMACAVLGHFGATFFHVAPQNVVRDQYGTAIRGYLYPEFRQGWSLFAPDLPRSDVSVHARVLVRTADGGTEMTDWVDLTATDLAEMHRNLLPSRGRHQLRKGWSDVLRYQSEHEGRGADVRQMIKRIALGRVPLPEDAQPEQIQFRSVSTQIPQPPWVPQHPAEPTVQDYDWWPVTEDDLAGGAAR